MNNYINQILLSIIVRSYNGSQYIYSTLESLSNQLDNTCEIIIVDNGSTDNTIDVINNFIENETFDIDIRIFTQKNSGPGGASNTGLDNAKGKYIGFLDSDDIFINEIKASTFELIKQDTVDIIEFGFVLFNEESNIEVSNCKNFYSDLKGTYNLKDIRERIFAQTNWYPFIRFYRNYLWESERFPTNVYYEDDMTLYKIFLRANTIHFINKPLLAYRQHSKSITGRHTKKQLEDLINFYWNINIQAKYQNIIRLRLARAISYFSYELGEFRSEYTKVCFDQKKIKINKEISQFFKTADKFYYYLPILYDFINWFRLGIRKINFFHKVKNIFQKIN